MVMYGYRRIQDLRYLLKALPRNRPYFARIPYETIWLMQILHYKIRLLDYKNTFFTFTNLRLQNSPKFFYIYID